MKILNRYILRQMLFYLSVTLIAFTSLFLIFDFLDRIDNIVVENPSILTVISYFLLKIPSTTILVIPLSVMTATILTVGLLSKNSEFTAMRACGASILSLTKPIIFVGFALSLITIFVNETVVPYTAKRVKEIYNIQIKKKDQRGSYSQSNFWWRDGNIFYSFENFDSSTNSISNFTELKIKDKDFLPTNRTEAKTVKFLDPISGWSMTDVNSYQFLNESNEPTQPANREQIKSSSKKILPLPILKTPENFYDVETEAESMSFITLRKFIRQRIKHGISVVSFLPELYAKLSFPLICVLITTIVIPFSVLSARSGSMATCIILSMSVSFAYYVIHSLSVSMGQAELISPFLSAWLGNIVIGVIGFILMLGAEAPA